MTPFARYTNVSVALNSLRTESWVILLSRAPKNYYLEFKLIVHYGWKVNRITIHEFRIILLSCEYFSTCCYYHESMSRRSPNQLLYR